ASSPAHALDERSHDFVQGLALCQTGLNEQAQTPQALCLGRSTSGSWVAFKIHLEYSLKPRAKVMVVLGCTQ
ncbi:MAG: hypothetical protein WAN58_04705, partial [Anaerolineales bacterium]